MYKSSYHLTLTFKPSWWCQKTRRVTALPTAHTPSPATWRRFRRTCIRLCWPPPSQLSSTTYRYIECSTQAEVGHGIDPPPIHRGSEATSGTPSGMMAQPQPTGAKSGQGEHSSTPIWRENKDVRSGLWPSPWMAQAKVPSAASRPTLALTRGQPRSGRIGGGGLSFGDFSLATQRKVTRPSPKGGRNPVEGPALASCTAPAVPSASAPSSPTLLPRGEKGTKTISETGPSPAMGERSKDDHRSRPLSHKGRREQRRSPE